MLSTLSLIRDFGKHNTRETFPKFPSVLCVIDRWDRNPPIAATSVTFQHSLRHDIGLCLVDFHPIYTQGQWGFCGKFCEGGFCRPSGSPRFAAGSAKKPPSQNLPQNAPSSLCVRLKQVIVLRHRIIFYLKKDATILLWVVEEKD